MNHTPMPSTPADPIETRLSIKTAANEARAEDSAMRNQIAKNGTHAAKAIAQRRITLRIIPGRLSQFVLI
jgi:hypothetical protein